MPNTDPTLMRRGKLATAEEIERGPRETERFGGRHDEHVAEFKQWLATPEAQNEPENKPGEIVRVADPEPKWGVWLSCRQCSKYADVIVKSSGCFDWKCPNCAHLNKHSCDTLGWSPWTPHGFSPRVYSEGMKPAGSPV